MTSRNSFTSNSSYIRYLVAGAVTCFCTVAVIMCASLFAIRYNLMHWHFGDLFDYQIAKLQDPRPIDVLLVGDSSLGNGVDARQWSRELNKNVVSLALTGVYGLSGSLNMIRRTARHHEVGIIIIMQTVDMMERVPNRAGDLYTAERLTDIDDLRVLDLVRALANWDILGRTIVRVVKSSEAGEIQRFDYVPQTAALSSTTRDPPQMSANIDGINPENLKLVRKIADECNHLKAACIYMNGPILETFCKTSAPYMTRVLDLVEATGLHVVRASVCLPWQHVGDSTDHVVPAKKELYSAAVLNAVRPFLESAAAVSAPRR